MRDHKKRIEELEKRAPAGEPIIIVDEIDGKWYWKGEETTETKIRESHKNVIILVDNIPRDFDIEQWRKDGRPRPIQTRRSRAAQEPKTANN